MELIVFLIVISGWVGLERLFNTNCITFRWSSCQWPRAPSSSSWSSSRTTTTTPLFLCNSRWFKCFYPPAVNLCRSQMAFKQNNFFLTSVCHSLYIISVINNQNGIQAQDSYILTSGYIHCQHWGHRWGAVRCTMGMDSCPVEARFSFSIAQYYISLLSGMWNKCEVDDQYRN